jgi:hypothetical protein
MPTVENFTKIVLRTLHATPSTVILRASPSPHNSRHRFPETDEVLAGIVYGPGQFDQQEYLTGTLSPSGGGGTRIYPLG